MRWRFDGAAEALHSPIPWVALSAALALTAAGWFALEHSRYDEARSQFERRTETAEAAIRSRMVAHEQILRSGAARIASSATISTTEWRDFIARLQLDERFPGVQSIGYAQRNKAADADTYPIVFNEPPTGSNTRAIGFDISSDPVRREAMMRARDRNDVAISAKIVLAGDAFRGSQAQQPGFQMFIPVFYRDARTLTLTERNTELAGYVLGSFRMYDLMRGVLDEGVLQVLDMRVFDSPDAKPDSELIDTRNAWRATPTDRRPIFSRQVMFQMPSRVWTIQFISRPEFDSALEDARPWGVLWAGIFASVVLFFLVTALVSAWNRAHQLSMRDPLTGLFNRRYLEETITRELPRARRMGENVGVIVLDIDHFKVLNDTYGHDAGDYVLERTGELLRAATRNSDIACRFGGEEFAIILPGASLLVARNRAEAIRAALESFKIEFEGHTLGPITVSAGVASMPPHGQDWSFTLQQADRALYTAKQAGRNKVVAAVDD
jgi:diguanylate cyclase (GGDEF)-like protein